VRDRAAGPVGRQGRSCFRRAGDRTGLRFVQRRYTAVHDGFSAEGTYCVRFYAMDTWGSVSSPREIAVTQIDFNEKAVIVAAGSTSDVQWATIERMGDMAYHALRKRYFGPGQDQLSLRGDKPGR